MRKLVLVFLALAILTAPAHARYVKRKNLYNLVDNKVLKVYLGDFTSCTDKITPEKLKSTLKDIMLARKSERFEIATNKEDSDIIINGDIVAYRYLDKDPIDHIAGGTTGLLVDAVVDQNYVQVKVKFTVLKTKNGRKLWEKTIPVSVTETDMPEADSIPKIIDESERRFIWYCFGKPKH